MSQAKVNRYKEQKFNRRKIMAKEKRNHLIGAICGWFITLVLVGWFGYSAYESYERSKPPKTIYANLNSVNDYMNSLNSGQ